MLTMLGRARYVELNPVRQASPPSPGLGPELTFVERRGPNRAQGGDYLEWGQWASCWTPAKWEEALHSTIAESDLAERIPQSTRTGPPARLGQFPQGLGATLGTTTPTSKARSESPRGRNQGLGSLSLHVLQDEMEEVPVVPVL